MVYRYFMKTKVKTYFKELVTLLLFSFIIVSSIIEYTNDKDVLYLIVPIIFIVAILSELLARFFGADQRKGRK